MKTHTNLIGIIAFLIGIAIFAISFSKKPPQEQNSLSKETEPKQRKAEVTEPQLGKVDPLQTSTSPESETLPEDPPGYYYELTPRPFKVTQSSENFEWTDADGKSPEVMQVLATNPDNLDQMADQNEWIDKRQLVYLTEQFKQQADSVFNGQTKSIKIPGFDGEELDVNINRLAFVEEDKSSYFEGTLKDYPDFYVDATLVEGIWSISYMKPGENFLYDYISRQDGELIMNRIDGKLQAAAMNSNHDPNDPNCSHCSPFLTNEVGSIEN